MNKSKSLPQKHSNAQQKGATVAIHQFHGPVPPPHILEGYKNVIHDAPERILRMAEKEQSGRLFRENKALNMEFASRFFGQVMAFLVVISGMAGGVFLVMKGNDFGGFTSMLGPLGIIAGLFVYDRKRKK
jgi:uncharacterized membrane protein